VIIEFKCPPVLPERISTFALAAEQPRMAGNFFKKRIPTSTTANYGDMSKRTL
jgi:hypothetical protein